MEPKDSVIKGVGLPCTDLSSVVYNLKILNNLTLFKIAVIVIKLYNEI